jgi:phage/plasmid primase-like uncharacterized protein
MLAGVAGPDRRIVAVQRTYLVPDGAAKAFVTAPRLTLGPLAAGAVRLAPPGPTLAIAEGVETALSFSAITGVPCWASLSAERLHRVELPEIAQTVIIAADHDEPGIKAAKRAAAHYRSVGREVRIEAPDLPGFDWNDVLRARATT